MDSELADVTRKMSLDSGEEELLEERLKVKKVLLQVDLKVERPLNDLKNRSKISRAEATGIRLPKISIPSFDRNILNWTSFWEKFAVVENNDSELDVEKLAYLNWLIFTNGWKLRWTYWLSLELVWYTTINAVGLLSCLFGISFIEDREWPMAKYCVFHMM